MTASRCESQGGGFFYAMSAKSHIYGFFALMVFLLFSCGFFADVLKGKRTSIGWIDNVEQYYLWSQFCSAELHSGRFPIIAPKIGAGMFFPGELQHSPFYPVSLVWFLLFGNADGISQFSLDMLVLFHVIIGGLGMVLLARSMKISRLSSIVIGLFFGFGGAFLKRAGAQAQIFFALSYMPLAFGGLVRFMEGGRLRWALTSGIGLGLSLLAGHFLGFLLSGLTMGFYFLWSLRNSLKKYPLQRLMLGCFIIMASCFSVSIIQFYPSALYQVSSLRWVGLPEPVRFGQKLPYELIGEAYRLRLDQLVQLGDPNWAVGMEENSIYLGLVPLICILGYSFLRMNTVTEVDQTRRHLLRFSCLLMVSGLILSFGRMTPFHYLLTRIPLLDSIRQASRYAMLFQIGGLLLFGLTLDFLFENHAVFHKGGLLSGPKARAIAVILLGIMGWLRFGPYPAPPLYFKFLEMGIGICIAQIILTFYAKRKMLQVLVILLVLINIYTYRHSYLRNNNISLDWPLENKLAAIVKDYRIMLDDRIPHEKLPKNIGFIGNLDILKPYGATLPMDFYSFLAEDWAPDGKSLDRFSVKYYIGPYRVDSLPLVFHDEKEGIYVHSRPNALPNVYSTDDAIASYSEEIVNPLERTYEIEMIKEGEVVFSELYHPGWRVKINGKSGKIAKTGGFNQTKALMGVYLKPGIHRVQFTFPFFGIFQWKGNAQ